MSEDKWEKFYKEKVEYGIWIGSPMIQRLIDEIRARAKPGDKLLEIGTGTGYTAIELSKMGYDVYGIDLSSDLVEQAEEASKNYGGAVAFSQGDMFDLPDEIAKKKFKIIYHQGVFEHFSNEEIARALKLQIPLCEFVIFSVPSFRYARRDFGNERLLNLGQWRNIVSGFNIMGATYYGESDNYILIILRGGLCKKPPPEPEFPKDDVFIEGKDKPEEGGLYGGDAKKESGKAKRRTGSVSSDSKDD